MKTNEQIFEDIKKQGYVTEQQIRLLKTRGTQQNKDLFDYTLLDTEQFGCGIPLTPDQNEKGLAFLRDKAYTQKGNIRKNCPFGYRELNIIDTETKFTFHGFYDAGRRNHVNLLPLYGIGGMEYYYDGEINVIG